MKQIPFSPPRIDNRTIEAVTEVLKSGWITTGPKTRLLEQRINEYCQVEQTLCLNSWTNAAELVLRWFGVGEGDEVIIPAYTYAATANIVIHVGATPVLADVNPGSFLVNINQIESLITEKTKVIMPVDIGGLPVDYDLIMELVKSSNIKGKFQPASDNQRQLGRILVLADAAHSFGATYKGKRVGGQTDVAGFSFHAVKNLTTAEGGAVTFNLPEPFINEEIRKSLNISALHGQTKDALSKTQAGQWRYDIIEAGYKCNMTDIHAAIGLVELERYQETLDRRKDICNLYSSTIEESKLFVLPAFENNESSSCYHLYMINVIGASESQRDQIITELALLGISTNVHFQPIPLLSFYKEKGYRMDQYPNAYSSYISEISLPVYYDLSNEDVDYISTKLIEITKSVMNK
jgi:dTDP-4-amino-4,6-dideoxygalactose transaminase